MEFVAPNFKNEGPTCAVLGYFLGEAGRKNPSRQESARKRCFFRTADFFNSNTTHIPHQSHQLDQHEKTSVAQSRADLMQTACSLRAVATRPLLDIAATIIALIVCVFPLRIIQIINVLYLWKNGFRL